jgi:hypothetical protein
MSSCREVSLSDDSLAEEVPGLDGLSGELEQALGQVRRAIEELPPLEEVAGLQETMAGLAQVGSVVGRMQLAAEQEAEAWWRMVGQPDWRMQARIRLSRAGVSLATVEFRADFDLARLIDHQDWAGGDAIPSGTLPPGGLAVTRDLRLQGTSKPGSGADDEARSAVVSAPHIPLGLSTDGELCMDLAPVITVGLPHGTPAPYDGMEDVHRPAALRQLRIPLTLFQAGKPFQRSEECHLMGLEFHARLNFRPLGGLDDPL